MSKLKSIGTRTVFEAWNIPAHDETFDIAESIGAQLDAFRDYVASVRDSEQADTAVKELLAGFTSAVE